MKLRPAAPPIDALAPTADEIARAMVAAADETGDRARLAAAVADVEGAFRNLATRARWLALEALNVLYPRVGLRTLARLLGSPPANSYASLNAAKAARWWSEVAVNRVIDRT